MVEGLKERDKEKLLIIGLGAFYIAIGEDAVLLHEKLGLKCTCFKNHICKVGIPRNSIGKYIKEIEKSYTKISLSLCIFYNGEEDNLISQKQ